MLYHIVAVANNRVIGVKNQLPWHFSSDLRHFKKITMGSTLIMGSNTFKSLGKPLPGRTNFVLDFETVEDPPGVRYFTSFEDALAQVETKDCFIIGGASLYEQTINRVDGIYLTRIHADYEGDAFYPEVPSCFVEKKRRVIQENPILEAIYYEK